MWYYTSMTQPIKMEYNYNILYIMGIYRYLFMANYLNPKYSLYIMFGNVLRS